MIKLSHTKRSLSMREESRQKLELQHTTTVWYSGSCTNKHNKLTDTSLQVVSNAKLFSFIYWCSILGWYGEPCHEEWTVKIIVILYKAGTVNHATMNEMAKITETIFIWHVRCIYRWRQIKNYAFGQKDIPCKIITKKVNIYVHVVAFCYAA